jgi:hypothetical protein
MNVKDRLVGRRAGLCAAALVAALVAGPASAEPYKRSLYGNFVDADHDCQDTRAEVLIIESLVPVTLDAAGCKVLKGKWFDAYTGRVFTNPRQLDIDHLVPLGEVHKSGGDRWGKARRVDYANNLSDPDILIAVSLGQNRSKGDRNPAEWLPKKNTAFYCTYIRRWVAIKARWNLRIDAGERRAIDDVLAGC